MKDNHRFVPVEPDRYADLRFSAFHEAGHAVADERLGFGCTRGTIEANNTRLGRLEIIR